MKKLMKTAAVILVLALCITNVPLGNMGKEVSASYVYLSHSYLTMVEGTSKQIKINGTKRAVTWSSANKSIATVSRGKIKAVKPGRTNIFAKVSGKVYKCQVTVNMNEKAAKKKIAVTQVKTQKGMIVTVKNNNKYAVNFSGTMLFRGENGQMLDTDSDYCYCLGAGRTTVLEFIAPKNSETHIRDFATGELTFKLSAASAVDCASKIAVEHNPGEQKIIATATNNSGKKLSTVILYVVYYDESGKAIAYEYNYAGCNEPGEVAYIEFSTPKDDDYKEIPYATYEVKVGAAYYY